VKKSCVLGGMILWSIIILHQSSGAEAHRATRLGNPNTRFAAPVSDAEDLRFRFRDSRLRPDIEAVLRQWAWSGRVEDLYRAAATAEIRDVNIAVGAVMPFMSSRENGKPICLRNVTWAGKEPTPALLFNFTSNGRRYRCVTPKACCNFYVEDLGLEPVPGLALECVTPREALPHRPVEICLIARNPGTGPTAKAAIRLSLPANASVINVSDGGVASQQVVTWELPNLEPKASRKVCLRVNAPEPGLLTFDAVATAANINPARSSCFTKVTGVPAVLLETVDLEDPIEIGGQIIYRITVTNQGSAELTNLKLDFHLPTNEEFVVGDGPTAIRKTETSISTDRLLTLAAKDRAVWRVTVKALQPGDVRFKIDLTSDQFEKPITQEESTRLY
jgi:uncharacterized repeat protein (TIGR01451 family)